MSHIGCDTSWCIVAYHWLKRIYRHKDNIFLHSMVLLKREFAVWVEIICFLEKSSSFFSFLVFMRWGLDFTRHYLLMGIANPSEWQYWWLGITNPQNTKRLGHFLTTDCKSVETPNGRNEQSPPGVQRNCLPPGVQKNSLPPGVQRNCLPPGIQKNSLPPGVPADLQSAVKKGSTYENRGICNPPTTNLDRKCVKNVKKPPDTSGWLNFSIPTFWCFFALWH